jgi:hypothetical protein
LIIGVALYHTPAIAELRNGVIGNCGIEKRRRDMCFQQIPHFRDYQIVQFVRIIAV